MRRGAAWALALALSIGGTAACGGDGGGGDEAAGTTASTDTTGSTTDPGGGDGDLSTAVADFCAKSEEFQALIQSSAEVESGSAGPVDPATAAAVEKRISDLTGELTGMLMTLQGSVSQMVPGDAARFQECAAPFSGGVNMPPQ